MATVRLVDGELDLAQRLVRRAGTSAVLSEQDAGLLAYLVARDGRAVPREELATEVLGHRVRETSRAVDHAIRRLRVKIEADPAHPRHICSVRGVGYQFRPVRSAEQGLVGRDEDLVRLRSLLPSPWLTLVGPGGVGKTTLARSLAAEQGGLVIALGAEPTVEDVVVRVAHHVGVSPQSDRIVDDVAEALASRSDRLLVLDDVDRVARELGDVVASWAAALPAGRSLLVTSRVRLGHRNERVVPLAPLADDPSWALFERRLPVACDVARDDAAELMRLLDGLPLAIELAASWMDLVSPAQLASRVVSLASRDARSERHASLERVLDSSWELLAEPERAALQRAAVFAGPFDLEAAEAVLGDPEGPPVLHVLGRLHDTSLLTVDAGPRYRLLAPVRAYARQRCPPDDALIQRHAAHALSLAERGGEALEDVVDEVRVAFTACLQTSPVLACKLAGAVNGYDWKHAPPAAAMARLQAAADAVGDLDAVQAARMRWGQGMWMTRLGNLSDACDVLHEALAMADRTDDPFIRSGITASLGLYLMLDQQYDAANELLEARLDVVLASGHITHRHQARMVQATLLSVGGQPAEADAAFAQAVALARESRHESGVADVLRFQGVHALRYGDLERAEATYAEALRTDGPDTYGAQLTRLGLVLSAHLQGRLDRADAILDEIEARAIANTVAEADGWRCRGFLAWERGAVDEAETLLARAEAAFARFGRSADRAGMAAARVALMVRRGMSDAASRRWDELAADGTLDALQDDLRAAWAAHLSGADALPSPRGRPQGGPVRRAWRLRSGPSHSLPSPEPRS